MVIASTSFLQTAAPKDGRTAARTKCSRDTDKKHRKSKRIYGCKVWVNCTMLSGYFQGQRLTERRKCMEKQRIFDKHGEKFFCHAVEDALFEKKFTQFFNA